MARFLAALLLLLLLAPKLTCDRALAQAMDSYDAELDGSQVVPPTDSPAEGTFYLGIDYTIPPDYYLCLWDLSGAITEISLHRGAPGTNGPLLYTLFPSCAGERLDEWRFEDWWPPLEGYVLVRTATYPDGEVRGDLVYHPFTQVEARTWGSIRALYR